MAPFSIAQSPHIVSFLISLENPSLSRLSKNYSTFRLSAFVNSKNQLKKTQRTSSWMIKTKLCLNPTEDSRNFSQEEEASYVLIFLIIFLILLHIFVTLYTILNYYLYFRRHFVALFNIYHHHSFHIITMFPCRSLFLFTQISHSFEATYSFYPRFIPPPFPLLVTCSIMFHYALLFYTSHPHIPPPITIPKFRSTSLPITPRNLPFTFKFIVPCKCVALALLHFIYCSFILIRCTITTRLYSLASRNLFPRLFHSSLPFTHSLIYHSVLLLRHPIFLLFFFFVSNDVIDRPTLKKLTVIASYLLFRVNDSTRPPSGMHIHHHTCSFLSYPRHHSLPPSSHRKSAPTTRPRERLTADSQHFSQEDMMSSALTCTRNPSISHFRQYARTHAL
ncbi:hypothetical protein BJ165DRAFT_1366559, partial [Panaeolus papilionaceus]